MKKTKGELLAYLAGILDGEGSVMIRRSTYRLRNPKYADCINPQFNPRVSVKNTNEDVIRLFKETFGGSYHKEKRTYPSEKGFTPRKIMFIYDVQHRIAHNLLERLLPFLVIKKEQAKLALSLAGIKEKAKERRDRSYQGFHGKPYRPEYVEMFEEIYQKVKELNA